MTFYEATKLKRIINNHDYSQDYIDKLQTEIINPNLYKEHTDSKRYLRKITARLS